MSLVFRYMSKSTYLPPWKYVLTISRRNGSQYNHISICFCLHAQTLLALTEMGKSLIEASTCFAETRLASQLVNTGVNLKYVEGVNLYFEVFGLMKAPGMRITLTVRKQPVTWTHRMCSLTSPCLQAHPPGKVHPLNHLAGYTAGWIVSCSTLNSITQPTCKS